MNTEQPNRLICSSCGGAGDVHVDAGCNTYGDKIVKRYDDGSSDVLCTACNGDETNNIT